MQHFSSARGAFAPPDGEQCMEKSITSCLKKKKIVHVGRSRQELVARKYINRDGSCW